MLKKQQIDATYRRESGLFVVNLEQVPLPESFTVVERNIVSIPAGAFGGNHKHPRVEIFIALNDSLELIWLGEDGQRHSEFMHDNGQLMLFTMPPLVPHAIVNRSKTDRAILFEFANDHMENSEIVEVFKPSGSGK